MQILLVDDHPVFRSGLAVLLGTLYPGAEVIEVGDYSLLKNKLMQDDKPDLILLDLMFPGFDAEKDFAGLRRAVPLTPIAVVSMTHDNQLVDNVMAAGANGFVSKSIHPTQMSQALRAIMDGDIVIQRATTAPVSKPQSDPLATLTARQIDVLKLLALGLSNKEIARQLELSPFTVRTHVSALLNILQLPTRSAVAAYATSQGFS